MNLISQDKAREIAKGCKFRQCCHLCFHLGEHEPMSCCAFCTDYGKCKGIVCPDFKTTCPMGLDKIHCQNCYFWSANECRHDEIMAEAK